MPRLRKALRLLCCLKAVKDDVADNVPRNLPVDTTLHRGEERRRETCPQREIGQRKTVLGSDGIHTEEFPKTETLNKDLGQQVLENSRAEIEQALRSAGLLSDKVAGGEGTKTEIILKDVNASTVDIEENGKAVLVINRSSQVLTPNAPNASCSNEIQLKFGTPAKILQFVLFRLDAAGNGSDPLVCTFLLTHHLFMPSEELCTALLNHLSSEPSEGSELERAACALRTRQQVGKLIVQWVALYGLLLLDNPAVVPFLEKLTRQIKGNACLRKLRLYITTRRPMLVDKGHQPSKRACLQLHPPLVCDSPLQINRPIRVKDTVLLKVHQLNKCVTLKLPLNVLVKDVVATMKASPADNVLVRMKSSGVKTQLKAEDRAISFVDMSERVFLCSTSQINKLATLQDQLHPESSTLFSLKYRSSKAIAAQLTTYDWELFNAIHETELLYYVVGRHKFSNGTTANLERYIGRFNEVSFWVPTELLHCRSHGKRVTLLKKFIDVATILYEQQNINSFTAIMYGLTNTAVIRLHDTWERLPKRIMKTFQKYEQMLDPFRNHKALRQVVEKLSPPYIPYLPLILKDLTFLYNATETFKHGLVNFEKMFMMSKHLKILTGCRNRPYLPISFMNSDKVFNSLEPRQATLDRDKTISHYIRNLKVITDQVKLNKMSKTIEL